MTNMISQSQQERSPRATKDIYVYSVVVQSIAVDENNVPEDTQTLVAYFTEPPFGFEFEEWAKSWIECGYQVVDKWLNSHQRFNTDKNLFETVWKPSFEI